VLSATESQSLDFSESADQVELRQRERGGIDPLVSNHRLHRRALARADTADPVLRHQIASIESCYRIGRLLVFHEALGQGLAGFSAATKCFCTEHEQRVAAFAGGVHGPEATLASELSAEIVYSASYTIMGGTSTVMRNILAERVLGLPKDPSAR
jgi:alkylation response protein AidB-like acyl-CoA dehydrogenase